MPHPLSKFHYHFIRQYIIIGWILALVYAFIEFIAKVNSAVPESLIPLLVRGSFAGILISGSAAIFELKTKKYFRQRPFAYVVVWRSLFYTFVIHFWLLPINGIWFVIGRRGGFVEGVSGYLKSDGYITNLIVIFILLILIIGINQVNSLHKKGELWRFILGSYHMPKEVYRIFCFIDLKSSTSIAEKLGHLQFGSFLKDYYSDITDALRETKAEIYQYVGDEIVLMWDYKRGIQNENAVRCFFKMRTFIDQLSEKYLEKYGIVPEFKAGLHGGEVIVTWVGEIKKEIVYVGDVLNTTSRIQNCCSTLGKDFLVSKSLFEEFREMNKSQYEYIKNVQLRGRKQRIDLYSL